MPARSFWTAHESYHECGTHQTVIHYVWILYLKVGTVMYYNLADYILTVFEIVFFTYKLIVSLSSHVSLTFPSNYVKI